MSSTCQTGIKNAVSKYVADKPYLKFNGTDFIQISSSPSEKVNPNNYFGVATSVASTLNKAINSNISIGRVFYPQNASNVVGVSISPTEKQLSLLNANDQKEYTEALNALNEEIPLEDRLDIENNTTFGVDEQGDSSIQYQDRSVPSSKASVHTTIKVKEVIKKMGVEIQDLADYAKRANLDVTSINGIADIVEGIIAIAAGKENYTLTEEMVHIATSILEQNNPKVVTELLSKIDRFKIYKDTYNTYKNVYTLSNGKPDIRAIKKEAVDKLIAEVIINNNEGSTQYPELLEERNRTLIEQWWEAILDAIRSMYRSSNINIFEDVANTILEGDVGNVSDIINSEDGIFYQIKNEDVDNFYNTIVDRDKRLELIPEIGGKKRHYLFDGKEVAKSITEKIKENQNMPERSDVQKIVDDQKKDWGSEGHAYLETFITESLLDENGYAKTTPTDIKISSRLLPEIKEQIEAFAKELINSYKPGTRFIIEKKVVNEKAKGLLASTVDFIAIEPDDKTGIKVDVLDWKFTNINKDFDDDIPWYKQKEWKSQMGEYTNILYNYGLKSTQLRKTRMIPFLANYSYATPKDSKTKLILNSLEIGKLDSSVETNLYLLPVPLDTELTTNTQVDALLKSLRTHYEKLYRIPTSPENKSGKDLQLNELSKAIRQLHLRMDFTPLSAVGKTFLNNAAKVLKEFENIDYSTLSKEDIQKKLGDLLEYQNSALKFATLDEVFLSNFPTKDLLPEDRKTLKELEHISSATERMVPKIVAIQKAFVIQEALKENLVTEETKENILSPEVEIGGFARTFLEGSKLGSKIIKLASNLIMRTRNVTNIKISNLIDEFGPKLLALEKEAISKGKSAFDMIGEVKGGKLKLIRKIDSEFWKEISIAKQEENKKFFLNNMDVEKYNKLAEEFIAKETKTINETIFSTEEDENIEQKNYRLKKLKDSLDINSKTFNGYKGYQFGRLFKESLKEEEHYSTEYKNMAKSKAALDMWNFFTALNQKAYDMGYLGKEGISFFPLMEATLLEKIANTNDILSEGQDFFRDLYTMRVNDTLNYSKIDPETNQIRKEIPKYFVRTDKEIHQLSRDLNKIGTLWIKALMDYENSKNIEHTLLTMESVERAKGHLLTDENGTIIFERGIPKVDERSNKNADILETIIDDAVYGLTENASSMGNLTITSLAEKFNKDEDSKEKAKLSIKKALNNSNILVRALAVGLKPLIAIANYFGVNFHAFINSGNMYTFSEYQKNNLKMTTGINLSTIERALLDTIVPLNDELTLEKRRELAKEQGYIKYLSTWNFNDIMMSTNSIPERILGLANALSFIDNSMVVNGKIVNIRQYVRRQDALKKKGLPQEERKALENSYEQRVKELKESSSLTKIAKIENDKLVIPNVSDEELGRYRTKIVEYGRLLSGQMNRDNKSDFTRDSILKSFMMFKTWIPKQISARTLDIQKNLELDEWEYGRARVFIKVWAHLGLKNILNMRDIIYGTDKGLKIMDEILQQKREEYYLKTGQQLDITEEEFYELIRKELSNQMKELGLLVGLMGLFIAAKAAEPPEDASDLERNRYNWFLKGTNKISDELRFYYNPLSFESITRGSIMPAIGLLTKAETLIEHVSKEGYGNISEDDKLMDAAHPTKYFFNIIPGAAQFQNEILPYLDPELAKELGIRVSSQSRVGM